jgi:hypothetical protein
MEMTTVKHMAQKPLRLLFMEWKSNVAPYWLTM